MITEDQIREAVFDRQRWRWVRISAKPGLLRRLWQAVFGKNPAEALYIVEHAEVDPDTFECSGAALAAWRVDDQGVRPVDPAEVNPGIRIRGMWQHSLVRMLISDDGQDVYLNELDGPNRGGRFHLQPREYNGQVTLKMYSVIPAHRRQRK